ncbi:hypothetical protein M8J75_012784 [Diaphorina citri]|nr:hypothetical protein M8J75_012784 [Diaphorina citri]
MHNYVKRRIAWVKFVTETPKAWCKGKRKRQPSKQPPTGGRADATVLLWIYQQAEAECSPHESWCPCLR